MSDERYDNGGWLPPARMTVNRTGEPIVCLTLERSEGDD